MLAKSLFLSAALCLAAPALAAPPYTVTPLATATATASGQPILLPPGEAKIIASLYVIQPGARLPLHKHPYPRFAYVLAGRLRVIDTGTGRKFDYKPGDFIVEIIDQWHYGENIGATPLRLLVIDTLPKAATGNTVRAE